jgi:hypothetical protein
VSLPRKPRALVRALDARRAMRDDLAYCRLAKMGSRAVDALLAKAGASPPYAQDQRRAARFMTACTAAYHSRSTTRKASNAAD